MEGLRRCFKENIEEIITTLLGCDRSYLSTADVDYVISADYLNELQSTEEVQAVYLANSLQQGFIYDSISQVNHDDVYHLQLL